MAVQCSVFIATSLDGFIARKNGDLDWLHDPGSELEGEDYGYKEFFDSVDILVMGRNSYEKVLTFEAWPYSGKRVLVLSRGNPAVPDQLSGSVEITSESPLELVKRLEQEGIRHIYVDGGKTIQGFLEAGMIQNLTITRIPVLIGEGIPLFGKLSQDIHLEHQETQAYPNGFVESRYRVVHAG